MPNQSDRQASVRLITGTASTYEGDWHSLFDLAAIPAGTYEGRLLQWINLKLVATFTELNSAMAAFAISKGVNNWDSLGTFNAA